MAKTTGDDYYILSSFLAMIVIVIFHTLTLSHIEAHPTFHAIAGVIEFMFFVTIVSILTERLSKRK